MGFWEVDVEGVPLGKVHDQAVICTPFGAVDISVKVMVPQVPAEVKSGVIVIGTGTYTI